MTDTRKIGTKSEEKAAAFLEDKGYKILTKNFRGKSGEIDIVATDGGYLVFVEVKFRNTAAWGDPLEAVSVQKQKKISKCAMEYIKKYGLYEFPVRFDVVGILNHEIRVIQNAFDYID